LWHEAGRPDNLDPFFKTAILQLSPLPQLEGKDRTLTRQSVISWLGRRKKSREKGSSMLGIEGILDTAIESRPRNPSRSRPNAFGSKDNKRKYYQSVSLLYGAYAEASERFRSGQYDVTFPAGMYRPPVAIAS
jgi:hypothetical protein